MWLAKQRTCWTWLIGTYFLHDRGAYFDVLGFDYRFFLTWTLRLAFLPSITIFPIFRPEIKKKVNSNYNITDLGSLNGNAQNGDFRIFLSSRFYASFWSRQKLPFWPLEQLWLFESMGTLDIFKCKIILKIKMQSLQNC